MGVPVLKHLMFLKLLIKTSDAILIQIPLKKKNLQSNASPVATAR